MKTKVAIWMIYLASYLPMYFVLLLRIVFLQRETDTKLIDIALLNVQNSEMEIIVLVVFIIASVIVFILQKDFDNNTRTQFSIVSNKTFEVATFLIPYMTTILTIELSWYGWMVCSLIIVAFGVFVVLSKNIQYCPFYIFLGYRLYKNEKNEYVLTKLTKDQFNQLIVDNPDGLEARNLTPQVLIVNRRDF